MAIKDILVYVDPTSSSDTRLGIALQIAERHNAHLVGLHVKPLPYVPSSIEFGGIYEQFIDDQQRQIDANAAAAQQKFETAARKTSVSQEWRAPDGFASDVVARHARYADLIVVGKSSDELNGQPQDLPEGILLTTGRPVLVVPETISHKSFAKNVMVAWDGGVQATRAVHDALPILAMADKVTVIAATTGASENETNLPCAEICLHLSRHGIKADGMPVFAGDIGAEQTILQRAFEQGCDLLVMGAYGHSRMKEVVFGGVTAHMLEHLDLPVLMSH